MLYMIEKALNHETSFKITTDRTSDFSNSKDRVDLQVEIGHTRQIFLIDIKTPYDNLSNLENSAKANKEKYEDLRQELTSKYKNWTITVETIVVGCLGSWLRQNDDVLRKVSLSEKALINLRRDAIASNIRWCSYIWHHHNGMHFNDPDTNYKVINSEEINRLKSVKNTDDRDEEQ